MSVLGACPECHGPIAGQDGRSDRRRWRKSPARADAGYCTSCHISLEQLDDTWVRERIAPLP